MQEMALPWELFRRSCSRTRWHTSAGRSSSQNLDAVPYRYTAFCDLRAEATHQKITGIESVVANDSNALAGELVYSEHEIDFNSDNNALSYSNSLKNPKATADMDIDVVWIME